MQNVRQLLAKELAKECKSIEDVQEKLKYLFKDTLQEILEAEMDEHLGYKKHSASGINLGNSRNGYTDKTLRSSSGKTTIDIPRDQIITKYQTTANELEDKIVALYAKGMSTRDIEDQMKDIYGIEVSPSLHYSLLA